MLAIAFSFPAGRYHAAPWGRHVNEADVAWPPDLWRITRALIAVWHRKLDAETFPRERLHALLAKLAEADAPSYRLPEDAIHSHTRHYMPGKGDKKTLVFDAFARIATKDPIVIAWPALTLDQGETALLDALLENLGFLGRAESWVDARRCEEPPKSNCVPSEIEVDAETGEITGETVRLLAPLTPAAYVSFRRETLNKAGIALNDQGESLRALKGNKKTLTTTLPSEWLDAIAVDTDDLQAAGWSAPPCARTVSYRRPLHALAPTSSKAGAKRPASSSSRTTMTTARFVLYGKPLPRIEDAVRVGEAMRRAVMSQSNRALRGKPLPSELSGHGLDDDNRHSHAFWLPDDADQDGAIDHLLVHVPAGFTTDAVRVLTGLQELKRDEGEPLRLMLEGIGTVKVFQNISSYARHTQVWQSATPYLYPWHLKKPEMRSAQTTFTAIAAQVRRECALRGDQIPPIESITDMDHIIVGGRPLRPLHFHRFRSKRGLTQPDTLGKLLKIRFAEPVQGPLALGFGCHFGLGLFRPCFSDDVTTPSAS